MSETDTDLPKTLIKRIVKRHLSQTDKGDTKRDTQINKDALLAFSESAKVFINYLTATANDVCKENKRQTISLDDIFRALEDTDFVDLIAPLKQSLEGKLPAQLSPLVSLTACQTVGIVHDTPKHHCWLQCSGKIRKKSIRKKLRQRSGRLSCRNSKNLWLMVLSL